MTHSFLLAKIQVYNIQQTSKGWSTFVVFFNLDFSFTQNIKRFFKIYLPASYRSERSNLSLLSLCRCNLQVSATWKVILLSVHDLRWLFLTSHHLSRFRLTSFRATRFWAAVAAPSSASFSQPASARPLRLPWHLPVAAPARPLRISSSGWVCWETS